MTAKFRNPDWNHDDWIVNNRLKHFLQNYLHFHRNQYPKLKNIRMCGSRVAHINGVEPAVFVLSNGTQSRFFANTSCHSVWACPACAAVRMANYCEDISAAIDALRIEHNQIAFMSTFTLPHMRSMSCEDIYNLLLNSWRALTHTGTQSKRTNSSHVITSDKAERGIKNRKGEIVKHKKGEVVKYVKDFGAFANMREQCHIKHFVRVYEFTYGEENGWHPHIHILFWTPKKYWNKILDFERPLLDQWWSIAKKQYIKLLDKKEPELKVNHKSEAEELFADWRKFPVTGHRSVFFSKNADGTLKETESAIYICDQDDESKFYDEDVEEHKRTWTADKEITQSHKGKKAAPGHYTPQQLIATAFDLRHSNPAKSQYLLKLFCDYASATFKHRRVEFTKTGLKQIIAKWKKSETFISRLKKKLMETQGDTKWQVVCWLSERQWQEITLWEKMSHESIKAYILYLACFDCARDLINEVLEQYDIKLIDRKHDMQDHIEKLSNARIEGTTQTSNVA